MYNKFKTNLPALIKILSDDNNFFMDKTLDLLISLVKISPDDESFLKKDFDKNKRIKNKTYSNKPLKYPKNLDLLYLGVVNNQTMALAYSPLMEGMALRANSEKVIEYVLDAIQEMYESSPESFVDVRKDKQYPNFIPFDAVEETWPAPNISHIKVLKTYEAWLVKKSKNQIKEHISQKSFSASIPRKF